MIKSRLGETKWWVPILVSLNYVNIHVSAFYWLQFLTEFRNFFGTNIRFIDGLEKSVDQNNKLKFLKLWQREPYGLVFAVPRSNCYCTLLLVFRDENIKLICNFLDDLFLIYKRTYILVGYTRLSHRDIKLALLSITIFSSNSVQIWYGCLNKIAIY